MAESFPLVAASEPERAVDPQPDWAALDATAQAALVRRGELSPRELTIAACERIERADGALGAVPVRFFDHALAAAERVKPQARFAGVPFLMKDVGARQAGQPYYAGNRALRDADHRADRDTTLGRRFREIGLVTVGNSNAPEFGSSPTPGRSRMDPRAIRGRPSALRADPRAARAPRSQLASCRSRTRATAPDRSGSRRRGAGSSD